MDAPEKSLRNFKVNAVPPSLLVVGWWLALIIDIITPALLLNGGNVCSNMGVNISILLIQRITHH